MATRTAILTLLFSFPSIGAGPVLLLLSLLALVWLGATADGYLKLLSSHQERIYSETVGIRDDLKEVLEELRESNSLMRQREKDRREGYHFQENRDRA